MELFLYLLHSAEDTGLQWSSSSTYFSAEDTGLQWSSSSTYFSAEDTGLQWSSSSTYFTVLRTQVYNGALSLHILQCHVVLLRKLCHSGGLVINSVTHKEMRAQATAEYTFLLHLLFRIGRFCTQDYTITISSSSHLSRGNLFVEKIDTVNVFYFTYNTYMYMYVCCTYVVHVHDVLYTMYI